jgi:hypothetical protein
MWRIWSHNLFTRKTTKRLSIKSWGRLGANKKTNSFPYSKQKKTQVGLAGHTNQQGNQSKNLRSTYLLRLVNRRISRTNDRCKAKISSVTASNLSEDENPQANKTTPAQKLKKKLSTMLRMTDNELLEDH